MVRPSGTVTFLFTDIEGSTRRWEDDPEAMRAALVAHDDVLAGAIDAHGGWLFKHTGDGVCAAFSSARAAIDAAVAAQRRLGLPVRMGVATGEAECRGDDYFGPVLNRTARVMAAGHGGQILLAASTAAVMSGVDLIDRGEHRLRDLSGVEHLYQVRAAGLRVEFAALRTLDAVPGNLLVQTTSFVGRDVAVKESCEQVRAHRLVTLTGAGGVGKSRLAMQVAAELTDEFSDGVWLVELAAVGDPAAVPDVVATVLGVTQQAGLSMTASLTQALSGRRLLLVLDNCEHLLDAATALVEELLTHTVGVRVLTTSQEVLRLRAEHVSPVPPLDVRDGATSAAVALFVERAQAVNPQFVLGDDADSSAVIEICRRLDGIALAIELAAARMGSMTAQEVRDRLDDRFRLLSGGHRGMERHQTLRQAVQWSYDLLDDAEKAVLARASVFAGGFTVAAASRVCDLPDEYAALDVVESLVRKSLLTVQRVGGHTRYGLLETIREYGARQLEMMDTSGEVRTAHARYFAGEIVQHWEPWFGTQQAVALEWFETEFANLRAAFRWAADGGDVTTAAAIAAHTAMVGFVLQMYEPLGWTEELLPVAIAVDVPSLPRLYSAASLCVFIGRASQAVDYAQTALRLENDSHYDAFEPGVGTMCAGHAHLFSEPERSLEIWTRLLAGQGWARAYGLSVYMWTLPLAGRAADARALADEALAVVRRQGQPMCLALALGGCGRAFAETDQARALSAFREGLAVCRDHRIRLLELAITREAATVETLYGDREAGLDLFDAALDGFHRAGNEMSLAFTFGGLAVVLDQLGQPDGAATVYGAGTRVQSSLTTPNLAQTLEHLGTVLGPAAFDRCVVAGRAMEPAEGVAYARHEIKDARRSIGNVA